MRIERSHLDTAVARGILDAGQAEALWRLIAAEQRDSPTFSFNHLLYYLGGLVAIGGISVFVTVGWEALGGAGLLLVALAVMAAGAWLTDFFLERQKLAIPAGLMAALVVAAAPLAVYGLQRLLGHWDGRATYHAYHAIIDWRWIVMELGTLAVGLAVLWRWRLPFSVMPIAVTLWYMSMDIAPLLQMWLTGIDPRGPAISDADRQAFHAGYWELRKWVSVAVGIAVVAGAFLVDLATRDRRDYAFWLHLAGVMAFWGGLSSMHGGSGLGRFLYFLINLALIGLGAAIGRRVYTVFGAFGVAAYLGDLAHRVFKDSLVFPIALMLIGLGVVWLGVLWQRHEAAIEAAIERWVPAPMRKLRRE